MTLQLNNLTAKRIVKEVADVGAGGLTLRQLERAATRGAEEMVKQLRSPDPMFKDSNALVLFFADDEDRKAFVAIFHQVHPRAHVVEL
jgi:hypothetical protein